MIRYLTSLFAVAALLLAGCGGDDDSAADGGTTAVNSSVPFDRAFIDGMVPHHEGAIAMANAAKAAGLSQPELVEIADAIIDTQQQEIDEMKSWRAEWFGSSEIDPAGADALGLSEEEMGMQHDASAIEAAEDVDGAFASMMIDHHNGAIQMAELALERAQHEEVRQLAEEITEAQLREVGIMEKYVEGGEHDTH